MPKKSQKNGYPTEAQIKKLIKEATKTREYAFCYRSKHAVGASVMTADGTIFGGCNVECNISGLGTCAERCAIDHAIAHGYYHIKYVCCVDEKMIPCCGACLQYVTLFSQVAGDEIYVINAKTNGEYEVAKLSTLLPDGYRSSSSVRTLRWYTRKGKSAK